jgi:hypothetical protein
VPEGENMKRLVVLVAGMAMLLAVMAPAASADGSEDYDIKLAGSAKLGGYYPEGTMIVVPVQVLCPAGESVYVAWAGVEGYNHGPDFPSMTLPESVTCTGTWANTVTYAASRARLEPPPWKTFDHGRASVTVRMGGNEFAWPPYAQTTKDIMINTKGKPIPPY